MINLDLKLSELNFKILGALFVTFCPASTRNFRPVLGKHLNQTFTTEILAKRTKNTETKV